jgi:hypothetical protein
MHEILGTERTLASRGRIFTIVAILVLSLCVVASTSAFAGAPKERHYSDDPLSIDIAGSEADVLSALEEVLNDQNIHGTNSYEKDKTLKGAQKAETTSIFAPWAEGGHVFYKVARDVLSPRHFKDAGDQGTVAVRYVVQAVDAHTTHIRIDAAYVETARRELHPSDGNVEIAEFGEIRDRLDKLVAKRNVPPPVSPNESSSKSTDPENVNTATIARLKPAPAVAVPVPSPAPVAPSIDELQSKVAALRRQVEAQVIARDAHLKAAPYKSAANVAQLPAQTHIVVLIITRYWFGVETPDGHHGWIPRSQVEFLQ